MRRARVTGRWLRVEHASGEVAQESPWALAPTHRCVRQPYNGLGGDGHIACPSWRMDCHGFAPRSLTDVQFQFAFVGRSTTVGELWHLRDRLVAASSLVN